MKPIENLVKTLTTEKAGKDWDMCAESDAKLRGKEVRIYMGYFGGDISVGDMVYDVDKEKSKCTREEMIAELENYEKEELAACIVDLIDNSEDIN